MLVERTWQPEQQHFLIQRQWEEWQQRFCASLGVALGIDWTPDKVGGEAALVVSQTGESAKGDYACANTLHLTGRRLPVVHAMPHGCVGHEFESWQVHCVAYPYQNHIIASMHMAFWSIQPVDDFPRWFFQGGLFFAYRDDAIEQHVQQMWLDQAIPPSLKRQWRQQAMPYYVQHDNGLPLPGFGLYPSCFQDSDFVTAVTAMSEWYDFYLTVLQDVHAWEVQDRLTDADKKSWKHFKSMQEDCAVQAQGMALPSPWLVDALPVEL